MAETQKDQNLLENLFKKKNFQPNKAQLEAITAVDGPLFLTAGPGSGKTRVLLWRTVNLIVLHNVNPKEIFLATFTEKAAHQLKEGLQGLLSLASEETGKPYDIADMYIGTLHSLCQKLLSDRRFNANQNRSHRPIIMDELEQHFFIKSYLSELIDSCNLKKLEKVEAYKEIDKYINPLRRYPTASNTNAVQNCIAFFNRMSEEDFSDDDILAFGAESDIEKDLFQMTVQYRYLLKSKYTEKVDFSILQQRAYKHISQIEEAKNVFKYIIVDEYQDTNTIQEKIYLHLAKGHKNICVVGDDDQALYRFRGATVENLVDFEHICEENIGVKPHRIDLSVNYRSRKQIVDLYTSFIDNVDWKNPNNPKQMYRIANKNITANSTDDNVSVLLETGKKDDVIDNIVKLIKELKEKGKIKDYNQCALLFPTLKSVYEKRFEEAFTKNGIPVYSPRANGILNTKEFVVVLGLFAEILKGSLSCREKDEIEKNQETLSALDTRDEDDGVDKKEDDEENLEKPKYKSNLDFFHDWLNIARYEAEKVMDVDENLSDFIFAKRAEIELSKTNYRVLKKFCEEQGISLQNKVDMRSTRFLASANGLKGDIKRILLGQRLNNYIKNKLEKKQDVTFNYVINRVTSLYWTLLDLFYQLNTFDWFIKIYEKATKTGVDASIYNLGIITQYLSRFMEGYKTILSGVDFQEGYLARSFFDSFLYTIYRLDEKEYEDKEDPFPSGNVPFLTIHQSKGLEFPVVVLGSTVHYTRGEARPLDCLVRRLMNDRGETTNLSEPLERMDEFDTMRMFYVALSRAQNLLIMTHFKGQHVFSPMKELWSKKELKSQSLLNIDDMPEAKEKEEQLAHVYTYTGDYLPYKNCPRSYMLFHKYGFVPSRSQTMFFGSLVHQSIEDLQNYIKGKSE